MMNDTKNKLEKLVEKYAWTLCYTSNSSKGTSYSYRDYNGINIIINEWDKRFKMRWSVPHSIFTIECPTCCPYDDQDHFDRIYKQFDAVVCTYRCGENYM